MTGPAIYKTPRGADAWAPIKDRLALADALLRCRWNLPITFRREGDMLIGASTLEVGCDLRYFTITQAEETIALTMKSAIMTEVDKAKKAA